MVGTTARLGDGLFGEVRFAEDVQKKDTMGSVYVTDSLIGVFLFPLGAIQANR